MDTDESPPLFDGEPERCSLCNAAERAAEIVRLMAELDRHAATIREAAELFVEGYEIDATRDWRAFNDKVERWLTQPVVVAARGEST